MSECMIFDSWTMYGPGPGKDPDERWKLEHLLEDIDFYGITGALVRHQQGYHYDPMFVNRMLVKEISAYRERLFPCWIVLPHQAGDFPKPKELQKMMEGEDVKAVWMSPAKQGYPINKDVLGHLADYLNEKKIPILLSIQNIVATYENLVTFCNIFNNCPVIFGDARWANTWRLMTAVMDSCPNTFLEFHRFQGNRAVELFSERYGIDRLLFGSGLLKSSGGSARGFVDFTLLDKDKIDKFAGENLARLLNQSPKRSPKAPESKDVIVETVSNKKPVPVPVFDAHCHILHKGLNGIGSTYLMPEGDIDGVLKINRHIGVDLTAVMSWIAPVGGWIEEGNKVVVDAVKIAPEEVVGLSTCDPLQQSSEEIIEMCNYLHLKLGFRGLKPYNFWNVPYNDKKYHSYWEFANRYHLYGLMHISENDVGIKAMKELAIKYPNVTFLIAHSCSDWHFARLVAGLLLEHSNIMAEITITGVPNGLIEWLCNTAGSERVIFGTDSSMRDPRPQLGWAIYTRLSFEDKKKMLAKNFAKVLTKGRLLEHKLPKIVSQVINIE